MPKKIDGISLSDAEHNQWKSVYEETGNAAIATSAIQKRRKNNLKKLNEDSKMDDRNSFSGKARAKQVTNVKKRNEAITKELLGY